MTKPDKRILIIVTVAFAFQLIFPQYSHAQVTSQKLSPKDSLLAIGMSPQLIFFDSLDVSKIKTNTLPGSRWREPVRKIRVTVTAYSSTVDQCDSTPFITANGRRVADGIVAANFLPFGTKVKIPEFFGDKVFSVEDRMNKRYDHRLDIWMPTRAEARQFGVRYLEIEIY
jgi:3D (Asp-Asp-Asp) domain-containing protein